MGWSSGGEIYDAVAKALDKEFGETKVQKQARVLQELIRNLEYGDCDVLEESFGLSVASDLALEERGYHNRKSDCEDNDDYTACSCGYIY